MKTLSLSILLLLSFVASGQTVKYDPTQNIKMGRIINQQITFVDSGIVKSMICFKFTDTTSNGVDTFCELQKAEVKKIGDIDHVLRYLKILDDLDKRQLRAAESILSNISIDGKVSNKTEFDRAVRHYLDVKTQNQNLILSLYK
jgi:hypothetical protein